MTRLILAVILIVAAASRPAQEPTSYLGAGESLALAGTPQNASGPVDSHPADLRVPVGGVPPLPAAVNVTASVGNVPSTSMPGPASTHTIRGTASWYCGGGSPCTSGHSPSELIAAIDPSTGIDKGERVTVWHGDRSVTALVVDVCACPGDRIVDLSRAAFSRLADPDVGLIRVTLVPARGAPDAPAFTLPPTSTED